MEDSGSRRPRNRAVRGARARRSRRQRLLEARPSTSTTPWGSTGPGPPSWPPRSRCCRSPQVTLTTEQPAGEGLAAPMEVAGETLWLACPAGTGPKPSTTPTSRCSGRWPRVGAIALANADLYGKVQQEKEKLEVITSSLAEGVCAISEEGEITFMNPSGAGMLGLVPPRAWPSTRPPSFRPARPRTSSSSRPCAPSPCGATSPATTPASSGSTARPSP